jgi:hypothetical protein
LSDEAGRLVRRFTNGFVLNLTGPYRMFFDRVNTPSTADKRQFTFLNGSHLETPYYGSHRLAGSTTSDTLRGGAMYFKDSSSNHFNTKWAVRGGRRLRVVGVVVMRISIITVVGLVLRMTQVVMP